MQHSLAHHETESATSNTSGAPRRGELLGVLAISLAAFIFMSWAKINTLHRTAYFDRSDDTGLFWTESAFHYRYAKMAAFGRPLPETDRVMQYPEGIHVYRDEMPVMEQVSGWLYRVLPHGKKPFHVFLLELVCVYSTLILLPAGWMAFHLFRRPQAGILTVLFYALTFPAIGPVVIFGFVRQDFALPILFAATCWWVVGTEQRKWKMELLGALAMAAAFSSWHLAQFYYLVLLIGCTVAFFIRADWRSEFARSLAIMTAVLFLAGLLVPALRTSRLILSTAMLISYALLATHAFCRFGRHGTGVRVLIFAGLTLALITAAACLSAEHALRYSHVYRLMWDKLRFLGVKPSDPGRMSFESRVMWTSSFLSPSWWSFRRWMGGAWIAALVGGGLWWWQRRRRPVQLAEALTLWMTVVFVALFALIQRMDVFAAFFVCLWAGALAPERLAWRGGSALRSALAVALVLYSGHNLTSLWIASGAPAPDRLRPLLNAIRQHTASNDVVLAHFPLSPVICAFTVRPVVIHSKFENRRVREKVREVYEALYRTEEEFWGVCKKYDVRYFVYEPAMVLDLSTESMRYMVNRMDLPEDAVAVRMQFLPESLRRFQLVFQTEFYRVYRVLEGSRMPGPVPFPRLEVYDSRRFRREDLRLWSADNPVGGSV